MLRLTWRFAWLNTQPKAEEHIHKSSYYTSHDDRRPNWSRNRSAYRWASQQRWIYHAGLEWSRGPAPKRCRKSPWQPSSRWPTARTLYCRICPKPSRSRSRSYRGGREWKGARPLALDSANGRLFPASWTDTALRCRALRVRSFGRCSSLFPTFRSCRLCWDGCECYGIGSSYRTMLERLRDKRFY